MSDVGFIGGEGETRRPVEGPLQSPWREMGMAWSRELRWEEGSGGFWKHSEVTVAGFADGFGYESKRGGMS